jgi:hypothetical protein
MSQDQPNTIVQCTECAISVEEPTRVEDRQRCPRCGSLARTFTVTLYDAAEVHDGIGLKARHGEVGKVKPYLESFIGDDFHRDRQEWRHVSRVIDREHDRYIERITDAAGNVVWRVDEPLRQHKGRGAAKRRAPTEPPP